MDKKDFYETEILSGIRMNFMRRFDNVLRTGRRYIYGLLYAVIIAAVITLTKIYYTSALKLDVMSILHLPIFNAKNIAIFLTIAVIAFCGLVKMWPKFCAFAARQYYKRGGQSNIFLHSFFLNIVCWGVWFLVYFPGTSMNDTINMIRSPRNNMQPLVYQAVIYYGIHSLTWVTQNIIAAFAIMVIVQLIALSLAVAWIIRWLSQKEINPKLIRVVMLFYAFYPIFGNYSIAMVKDVPAAMMTMLLVPMLYDIVRSNGRILENRKFCVGFLFAILSMVACRPNGLFVIGPVLILLLCVKQKNKKQILCMLVVFAIAVGAIRGLERNYFEKDDRFRSSVSIPLVQIGAVLNDERGYISDVDKVFLNNILILSEWEKNYQYAFVDRIKLNTEFNLDFLNENKTEFFRVWLRIVADNPAVCVHSYLAHTFGVWHVSPRHVIRTDFTQSFFKTINNNTREDSFWGTYLQEIGLHNIQILPAKLSRCLDGVLSALFRLSLLLTPGIMIWTVAGCVLIFLHLKKVRESICFLPLILTWITFMISTPASYVYRYDIYLTYSTPVVIILVILETGRGRAKMMLAERNERGK